MIFTFGPPDLYFLPKDVNGEPNPSKGENGEGSSSNKKEEEIINIKISYCNNYLFILTKKVLFVYSNGTELLYLGRMKLSETQYSELGNFRDLVVLPSLNLLGILVDNLKHMLIVNYQNPNLTEVPINTPVQTPTNMGYRNANDGEYGNQDGNSASSYISPTPVAATPLATSGPVSSMIYNYRFSAGSIGTMLNRVFHPSENEEVGELRDSFTLYLKSFLNLRLVYDIIVPSDFTFMFVVNQQFVFWTKELYGFYATIASEGFWNLLINEFSNRKKTEEPKRVNLYLVTTNLLNNVNIIGNVPLSYGLCYINLQSMKVVNLADRRTRSVSREEEKGTSTTGKGQMDVIVHKNNSLFQMIFNCVTNINNTDPTNMVPGSSANKGRSESEERPSIDSDSILGMLERQTSIESNSEESRDKKGMMEETLIKEVKGHFMVDNYLFLLSSDVLFYININQPRDYEGETILREKIVNKGRGEKGSQKLGKIVWKGVEKVCINEERKMICAVFKGNKIKTYHMNKLEKPIGERQMEEEVEDITWINDSLAVVTGEGELFLYNYAFNEPYTVCKSNKSLGSQRERKKSFTYNEEGKDQRNSDAEMSKDHSIDSSCVNECNGSYERTNHSEETLKEESGEERKKTKVLVINNNLKLLIYNGQLLVHNLYISYESMGNFKVFLNGNKILIISYSSFMSPTKSFGAYFNTTSTKNNKDLFVLKLPNSTGLDKTEREGNEEDQPHGVDEILIKNVKINKTANYLLIHYVSSGLNAFWNPSSGVILYDNRRYKYTTAGQGQVISVDWFTNHIFYVVTSNEVKGPEERLQEATSGPGSWQQRKRTVTSRYKVHFYSINDLNEVIIEIPLPFKPVATCKDNPYLFSILDENNQLYCYDLFYIQYKVMFTFNIDDLYEVNNSNNNTNNNYNNNDNDNNNKERVVKGQGEYWIEMHVFGFKRYLLLNLYRELYLVTDEYVEFLIDKVNQVISNNKREESLEYLITTWDNKNYLLWNNNNEILEKLKLQDKTLEDSKEQNNNNNNNINNNSNNTSNSNTNNSNRERGMRKTHLHEVRLFNPKEQILSINDSVMVYLTLNEESIELTYTLLPTFLFFEEHKELTESEEEEKFRRRELLFLDYYIYYFNTLTKEESKKNKEKAVTSKKEEFIGKLNKKMKDKLFAVICRKQTEPENVSELEREFKIEAEECFNSLMEEKEYEFASLLLLPIQIKTDPYQVRKNYSQKLIRELVIDITGSAQQTLIKTRKSKQMLLMLLVKFHNRLSKSEKEEILQESGSLQYSYELQGKENELEEHVQQTIPSRMSEEEEELELQRGIEGIVDLRDLIHKLMAKLNFLSIYQLGFLDNGPGGSLERSTSTSTLNTTTEPKYLNEGLRELIGEVTKECKELEEMRFNILLYFVIEYKHLNYLIHTTTEKITNFYTNKYIATENLQLYMLIAYKNFIQLTHLVMSSSKIHDYILDVINTEAEGQAEPDSEFKNLLRKMITSLKNAYSPSE